MQRTLGPVLALQQSSGRNWTVSALVAFQGDVEPPRLCFRTAPNADPETVAAGRTEHLQARKGRQRTVASYSISTALGDDEGSVTYWLETDPDTHWTFQVPASHWSSLRMAYASCNGFSHVKTARDVDNKYERWIHARKRHDESPLHVMLLGGDQVYGDPIWEQEPAIREWAERDGDGKWRTSLSKRMRAAAQRFYLDLYEDRWTKQPFAGMLASVPSLMMWDDHDIFDGWGSYPEKQTQSPVYQGIFEQAERHFEVFQLQNGTGQKGRCALCSGPNKTYAVRIGSTIVLALDMRTERTDTRVISPKAWEEIYAWLDANVGDACTHLLVMSSVPVVHLDFGAVETALSLVPGQQSFEDDFRDHWLSRPHRKERLRLIHRLFGYARDNSARVTILSGDIHVGGMGFIEDRRNTTQPSEARTITQLISSPVVHPTPPKMLLYAYDALNFFEGEQEVDQGLYSRMAKLPASDHRFIGQRNWLELEVESDERGRLWANWHPEPDGRGKAEPYTAVVHRIGAERS